MSTWYERNREKAISNARTWRLSNLDRYRALQKAAKRRKRQSLRAVTTKQELAEVLPEKRMAALMFVPAPGWDYYLHGDYTFWCQARGIDPQKSWTEPTDEYFD